jgi:carboxyl-terminal processing protease
MIFSKYKNFTFYFIVLVFILISCSTKKEIQNINGTWIQEGYGRIISISDSTYTYFNTTEKSCLPLIENGILTDRFRIVNFQKDKLVLNPGGIVDYNFYRIDSLPENCKNTDSKLNHLAQTNFEVLWSTFEKQYAFFNQRNINWIEIKKQYQPKIDNIKTDRELYKLFNEILGLFNDGHIKLDVPDSLVIKSISKKHTQKKKSKKDITTDIISSYLSNSKNYNNGVIKWGIVKNSDIGYIQINDMNNFSNYVSNTELSTDKFEKEYNKVLQNKTGIEQLDDELKGVDYVMPIILNGLTKTKTVIVDLRFNGGGYETVALKLLSYFINEPKHILSVKAKKDNGYTKEQKYVLEPSENIYKGKLIVLTSHRTASAAEIFALGTLAYPEIKRFGSSTNGIFSEILWKNLPNGWEFSLSNEVYSDQNGNVYEITGVPVNNEINYSKDRNEFYNSFYNEGNFKDSAIEKIKLKK